MPRRKNAEPTEWTFELKDGKYYLYARRYGREVRHELPIDGDYYDVNDIRLKYIKKTMMYRLGGKGKVYKNEKK